MAFERPAFQRRGWRARSEHLRSCIVIGAAHFLRINVGFVVPREGRGCSALIRQIERARRRTRLNSSDAFIVFFSLAVQRCSGTAAAAPPCVE